MQHGVHLTSAIESAMCMAKLKLFRAEWRLIFLLLEPSGIWKRNIRGYRTAECGGVSSLSLEVVDIVQTVLKSSFLTRCLLLQHSNVFLMIVLKSMLKVVLLKG